MSHLSTYEGKIQNIQYIKDHCHKLGWTVFENRPVRFYAGDGPMCDYVIEMNDPNLASYNIGLRKTENGYEILCDNSMRGPVLPVGKFGGRTPEIMRKLKKLYVDAMVNERSQQVRAKNIREEKLANGKIAYRISL